MIFGWLCATSIMIFVLRRSCQKSLFEGSHSLGASFIIFTSLLLNKLIFVRRICSFNYAFFFGPQAAASIKDGKRILFQFDKAAFSFKFLPFKFPYPVPFRLLGDEAKGWLDTTYLSPSGNLRISRGNKVNKHSVGCRQ